MASDTASKLIDSSENQSSEDAALPQSLLTLNEIIDNDLCHRCGTCIGMCPVDVLGRDHNEFPKIVNLSACTDCNMCVRTCPGVQFDYQTLHKKHYGVEAELQATHGHFLSAAIAHATNEDLRINSTSGGLITAILLHLLDSGQIDGALVVGSDEETLWKGKPKIARTREEILEATKSKYAICPTNSMFEEIRATPGRYAIVGLPCQIHGFVKAAELNPRIRKRVVFKIGLFCHAAIEHEAFEVIWGSLGEKGKQAKRFISRIGKHPGTPHIELADGTLYPVYFGNKEGYRPSSMEVINILYRLYSPPRCLKCFDAMSEFADISVGDPWMPPPADDVDFKKGWSFALKRSQAGQDVYNELIDAEKIVSRPLTREEALVCNRHMATEKRLRAFKVLEELKSAKKALPLYATGEFITPKRTLKEAFKTRINLFTHSFCYLPKYRARLLKFFLGNGGYLLLWLNNKRRSFKLWLRDG